MQHNFYLLNYIKNQEIYKFRSLALSCEIFRNTQKACVRDDLWYLTSLTVAVLYELVIYSRNTGERKWAWLIVRTGQSLLSLAHAIVLIKAWKPGYIEHKEMHDAFLFFSLFFFFAATSPQLLWLLLLSFH